MCSVLVFRVCACVKHFCLSLSPPHKKPQTHSTPFYGLWFYSTIMWFCIMMKDNTIDFYIQVYWCFRTHNNNHKTYTHQNSIILLFHIQLLPNKRHWVVYHIDLFLINDQKSPPNVIYSVQCRFNDLPDCSILIIIIIASTYKAPLTQKGSLGAVQIRVLKNILWWIYNIKSYIKTTTYRNT